MQSMLHRIKTGSNYIATILSCYSCILTDFYLFYRGFTVLSCNFIFKSEIVNPERH